MTDRYAVIGHPVAHSKSPLIHAMFAEQTGQSMQYERMLAPLDGFAATLAAMRAAGFKGANVTVPFKFEAYRLAETLTARAAEAGAVNTLVFSDQGVEGDNTDGAGLVRDIQQNLAIGIAGKRVLLIGAGGAAEGVLSPVLEQGPDYLTIVNRTPDRALDMVKRIGERDGLYKTAVQAAAFEDLPGQAFDIVINATSAGLSNSRLPLPPELFAPGALAYDMMYGHETPFMAFARECGSQVADGLGMLVEQAAESFYLWRHVWPQTTPVIARFRV